MGCTTLTPGRHDTDGILPPFNFVWDVQAGLPLLVQEGATSYIYGPGGLPLEQINGSSALWLHHDQLGSTRVVTDGNGSVQASYTFDAYGNLAASTGAAPNPLRFAGQYQDPESGLYYLSSRYYDPGTGQFISPDPLGSITRQPYGYSQDNPIYLVDPSGLSANPLTWNWGAGWNALTGGVGDIVSHTTLKQLAEGESPLPGILQFADQNFWRQMYEMQQQMSSSCLSDRRDAITQMALMSVDGGGGHFSEGWRGTNMSAGASFKYHFSVHGAGRSATQYAQDARDWAAKPAGVGTPVKLADGSMGLRYRTPGGGLGGILDSSGNIISFWYQ